MENNQQDVAATPTDASITSQKTVNLDSDAPRMSFQFAFPQPCLEIRITHCANPRYTAVLFPKPHDDFDITIIWHNMDSRSNFICFRKESRGPIERILASFGKVMELGVFDEVMSVNASKHLFCVTVCCEKNKEDGVMDAIHSVP
jgi:hypothetical protein